jgi:hypothetical protein
MSELDDLMVRVQSVDPRNPGSGWFNVELWMEGGRRVAAVEPIMLSDYQEPSSSEPQTLVAHGVDLFNRIFSGRLLVAFQQTWAAAAARDRQIRLRLALDPAAPFIHAIPWELMHFDDSGGVSPPLPIAVDARVSFSRYIESAEFVEGTPIAHRPVRMLLIISMPRDLERWNLVRLDKTSEERDFRSRFSPIINSGQFVLDSLPVASEQAIHSALAQGAVAQSGIAKAAQASGRLPTHGYDVVLFYGHALHHVEDGSRFVLEDPESGNVRLYDGSELVTFFQKLPRAFRPGMLVLVACNSATVVGDHSLNSLAARLVIDSGIPAVLAMQRLVEVTLARRFTYHLGEHLLREGLIDVAVNAARRRVFQPDSIGWTTPVLYMRYADGQLFTPNAQLEYVESVLRDPSFVRWGGSEYIDTGVLSIAPGQDWNLLRIRPEDAPASSSAIESLRRALVHDEERAQRRRGERIPARTNLLALIGAPHSGQTTVLRRLTFELAEQVTQSIEQPTGVYISLSGYEQQHGTDRLVQHIIASARSVTPALEDALSELFRPANPARVPGKRGAPLQPQQRFVFLLDNLDAVQMPARLEAAQELAMLAQLFPSQYFVVTSALATFPDELLRTAQVFVIQPLSEQHMLRYLRQRNESQANRIYRQIRENRLLALAADPSLLALIFIRLEPDAMARITRNQLVEEYLDRALGAVAPRYSLGAVARESLAGLAWYSRWNHQSQIDLNQMFAIMANVRRDRDYSLEDLYSVLVDARLLMGVGTDATRFVNPAIQSYCTAVALIAREDYLDRLNDIVTLCSDPQRVDWWEDVLYALAGMLIDPVPLFRQLAAAIRAGGFTQALIAARCLEALPPEREALLPSDLRAELIDNCALRLRYEREPSSERRAQIVTALGRLSYHQVRHELRRILVEKVRQTSNGPRYEYTNVRIAAARALRNLYMPSFLKPTGTAESDNAANLVVTAYSDEVSNVPQPSGRPMQMPSLEEMRNDQLLVRLMRIWLKGPQGRDEFRDILRNSPHPPERALAAFKAIDPGYCCLAADSTVEIRDIFGTVACLRYRRCTVLFAA